MGCCFSQPDPPTDLQEPTQVTALTTENNNNINHSPTSVPQYNEQEYIDRKDTIQLPTTSTSIESANEKNNHSEALLAKEENEKEKSSTSSLQPAINIENNDHHQENEKEEKSSKIESNLIPPTASMPISSSSSSTSSSLTWPIAIRLSSLSSKDILFDLPIEEPFWTIKDLKQQLMPHIESLSSTTSSSTTNNNTSLKKSSSFKMKLSSSISSTLSSSSSSSPHLRIVFIRLGKILDDDLIVIPSSVQKESNLGNVLILEKEGVIQAMVSKTS
ncbi:hypothetical protein BJ944DRAFT_267065 [Cunninghamella echinulata]|nr:hypothetical protein BJ944DRAFT_267065 [Cunninghamella echinulata]